MSRTNEEDYWTKRYTEKQTGWDIGYPSTPIKKYIDQLEDKTISILIPGAGNAYEAEYLWQKGFSKVHVLDISAIPLRAFQLKHPDFPESQLIHMDFFKHQDRYDLVLEQTFFCSFTPTKDNRANYAKHMSQIIKPNGKLVGVWFNFARTEDEDRPPFGGTKKEYLSYFEPHFNVKTFEICYNSIPPRQGNELFGVFTT